MAKYCKFNQHCRNRYENQLCKEEDTCNTNGCIFRHPKVCRNFKEETSCRFGDDCAYKHKETNSCPPIKEEIKMHADKMKAIQDEVSVLKATISRMGKNINDINQEIEIGQKQRLKRL